MALDSINLSITYIVGSILVIIILIIMLNNCKHENFCACRNMTSKRCPNPEVLTNLYNDGKLTEFTNFAKIQENNPYWKTIMPDDIFEKQMKDKWSLLNKNYEKKCN
jgi:hypothetical protein